MYTPCASKCLEMVLSHCDKTNSRTTVRSDHIEEGITTAVTTHVLILNMHGVGIWSTACLCLTDYAGNGRARGRHDAQERELMRLQREQVVSLSS